MSVFRHKRVYVILAAMLAFFMIADTCVASATTLSELKKEISEKEAELEEGEDEEESLASKVSSLEEKIYELESEIADGEAELEVLEAELEEAEAEVEEQNEDLSARLRNMYKNGTVGFVDVLLESGSFSEFLTNLDMIQRIYASDQEVLEELETAYDSINEKKTEVETLQAELEESKAVAEEEMATVEEKKAEIAASNEETEKMLDELNEDAEALTAKLKAEAEAEAAKKSSSSSSSTSSSSSGSSSSSSSSTSSSSSSSKFIWPVSGTVSSEFGWRLHPIYGYYKYHSGIDIAVSTGTSVKAAASGTVTMSSWYGGYGYCVMINHGNGLVTLYGHNSKLCVSVGDTVSQGTVIAKSGSTGNSTGPHVHFEVRKNGTAVNPRNYLP